MTGKQVISIALVMTGGLVLVNVGSAQGPAPDCTDLSTLLDNRTPFAIILESGALKKTDGSQIEAACRDALRDAPANPTAMFQLARALTLANKAHEAIKYYLDAADRRHAGAMNDLGGVFEYGLGIPKNLTTALEWYERAAEFGHAGAMTHLGELSEKGAGVSRDLGTARHWYEKAAMLGDAVSMNSLANLLRETGDPAAAVNWYRKAAEQGLASAMRSLGELSEAGLGAAQDYGTARDWYRKAADLGDADAMGHLGGLLESGLGGPQNLEAAREWYVKGAALGGRVAMHNLGSMIENGRGMSKDVAEARSWYERAAVQAYPPALNELGRLYRDGTGGPKNYAQAKSLFEQASSLGDAKAMNNLGLLYLDGKGVMRDIKTARTWFEKAAALNNVDAQANLKRLDQAGLTDGTQIAVRRASCVSSCAELQRSFVNAVCERYSTTSTGEKSDREKCIDTSLTLAGQCRNTCRDWASTLLPDNRCLTCFHSNIACNTNEVPINCIGSYADCMTRCSREMTSSGIAN
jgi:TPR repeat protein